MQAVGAAVVSALVLCQCASGPAVQRVAELADGDQVEVVYRQGENFSQTLRWPADPKRKQPFGSNHFVRDVERDEMQGLLDSFATLGFFEHEFPPGASGRASLAVTLNGRHIHWPSVLGTPDQIDAFTQCLQVFQFVFNRAPGYQALTSEQIDQIRRQAPPGKAGGR